MSKNKDSKKTTTVTDDQPPKINNIQREELSLDPGGKSTTKKR